MTTTVLSTSIAERYLSPLIYLSDNVKLEIISKLSASMMHINPMSVDNMPASVDLYNCFQGDWGEGQSSELYCQELRKEALLEPEETATW